MYVPKTPRRKGIHEYKQKAIGSGTGAIKAPKYAPLPKEMPNPLVIGTPKIRSVNRRRRKL